MTAWNSQSCLVRCTLSSFVLLHFHLFNFWTSMCLMKLYTSFMFCFVPWLNRADCRIFGLLADVDWENVKSQDYSGDPPCDASEIQSEWICTFQCSPVSDQSSEGEGCIEWWLTVMWSTMFQFLGFSRKPSRLVHSTILYSIVSKVCTRMYNN